MYVLKESIITWAFNTIKVQRPNDKNLDIRIRYSIEVIIDNIKKLAIMFALMVVFDTLLESVIVLVAFNVVRCKSFGLHASNTIKCIMISTSLFILLPKLCSSIILEDYVIAIWFLVLTWLANKYAPGDTKKNPIVGEIYRNSLRIAAGRNILPVTYKILGRERDNYERYECRK